MSKAVKKMKEPGSAITHFIGMLMALFAATPLIIKAMDHPGKTHIVSIAIFLVSMFLLYTASTTYHTFDVNGRVNKVLRKMDHAMIFVMIAGSYTPICVIVLGGRQGMILLAIIWSIAIAGILFKMFWITCPKWLSSVMYIIMGWACVLAFSPIMYNMTSQEFGLLLTGGVIYTVGGVIYALKLPIFNGKHKYFGSHEIFHLFVLAGSVCHIMLMYHLA